MTCSGHAPPAQARYNTERLPQADKGTRCTMNRFSWWWIHVFLRSFTHYILLPATLLFIMVLLLAPLFKLGYYVGIPEIVQNDDALKRALGAGSLGILWLAVLYCGYVLWLK